MLDPQRIEEADVAAGLKLAERRHEPAVRAAAKMGELSDQEPLYAISAVVLVAGAVTGNKRLATAGARMLASAAAAAALKSLVKRSVTRTRPHVLMDEDRYETDVGGSPDKPEQSFPSGHAAGGMAVARALTRVYPRAGAVGLGAAAMAGLTRVLKGAHYPVDVMAGAAVGLVSEMLVNRLARVIASAR